MVIAPRVLLIQTLVSSFWKQVLEKYNYQNFKETGHGMTIV